MALPEFNENGLLPKGVHPATPDDLKERCVTPFPTSVRRPVVFAGFTRYRTEIAELGVHSSQLVDGSFIDKTRLDPDDVDTANFCNSENLNSLQPNIQSRIAPLLAGAEDTKKEFLTHTFLVVRFPLGHPLESRFEAMRRYWLEFYSQSQDYRDGKKVPAPWRGQKGLVSMSVGDPNLCPPVNDFDQ
jgi:hypothetical protein